MIGAWAGLEAPRQREQSRGGARPRRVLFIKAADNAPWPGLGASLHTWHLPRAEWTPPRRGWPVGPAAVLVSRPALGVEAVAVPLPVWPCSLGADEGVRTSEMSVVLQFLGPQTHWVENSSKHPKHEGGREQGSSERSAWFPPLPESTTPSAFWAGDQLGLGAQQPLPLGTFQKQRGVAVTGADPEGALTGYPVPHRLQGAHPGCGRWPGVEAGGGGWLALRGEWREVPGL